MPELTEPYVMGLLADLEAEVPELSRELAQAKKRAGAVDAELSNLVRRLDASKATLRTAQSSAQSAALEITEKNMRLATLHQEIAGLKTRSDDLKTEMDRVGPGAIHRRLRRDRAKLSVRVEDREEEINGLRGEVDEQRFTLQAAEATVEAERDRSRAVVKEVDKLQSQLPSPYLFAQLFDRRSARAHCRLFLDHEPDAWAQGLRGAIGLMIELHGELRAGKYRLDQNSDLVGGRAMATAEALFAAAAIGDMDLVKELFTLATDPSLFFHQIFNIFRVWCLGLYLSGSHTDLHELLRIHQFATGLRGGYVETFYGLLKKDTRRIASGLKAITKHEWEIWQDPRLVRGAGVVNLGAVALTKLALDRGIAVRLPGPTVPDELIGGKSSRPRRRPHSNGRGR